MAEGAGGDRGGDRGKDRGRERGQARQDTRTAILDAALEALSRHGLSRASLGDVARLAGLSRPTVYRYFATKAELVAAVILREEEAFIARVSRAIEGQPELRPAMEALVAECLRAARDHPLLDRLLQAEPEALLPYLLTSRSPVLSAAAPVAEDLLRSWLPHLSETEVHRAADAVTRLLVSYGVTPPEDSIEEVASGLATLLVTGLKEV